MEYQLRKLANTIYSQPSVRYIAYLRSPAWYAWPNGIRARALIRAGGRCQICKRAPPVAVHHWSYRRLGNEEPEDLCAVCLRCHHKLHGYLVPEAANDNQLQLPLEKAA